ncbi:MAG: methyltransferase [Alphaproteobacteria bacterium]
MSESTQPATAELTPSAAMLRVITGFRVSRAVYVAAKLGVADLLKDGPRSSEELAQMTGTHEPSLYRVLRALVSVGIFVEAGQGRFALTPTAATLRNDIPGSLRAWVILVLGEEHYQAWGDLMHTIRTAETSFNHVFGMGVFQYEAQHSEHAKIFDQAMANLVGVYNAAVLASYSFSSIEKIVDVGGGDGSLIRAILQGNPSITGILFDMPHVAETAKRKIAEAGLSGRCEVIAGDAFVAVPSGGDACILSRVINSFENERALVILRNCRRALTKNGKLLLVERALPERVENSIEAQGPIMSDLNMMVMSGGRERTATEHRDLLAQAGFALTRIIPTQSEVSVIEAEPA